MKMHQVAMAMGTLCGLLVVGCGGARTKPDAYLFAQYVSAIKSAVTSNWLLPDGLPETSCKVHIEQLPGGQVVGGKGARDNFSRKGVRFINPLVVNESDSFAWVYIRRRCRLTQRWS